jgi:hypothetical protein
VAFLPTLPKINVQAYFVGGFEQSTADLASIFQYPATLVHPDLEPRLVRKRVTDTFEWIPGSRL